MKKTKYVGATIGRPHFEESVKSPFNKGAVSEADWGFSNKGITLIALIITIIVMLILVMVSIQIALNTGLFDTAGKATGDWNAEQEREQELASGQVTIGNKTYENINDYLNNKPIPNIKINLKMTHYDESITGENVDDFVEGVPIPAGFYYVGGTKNGGLVISDDIADKNKGLNVELVGNQFVWVPVLQNQKIQIDIESKETITDILIEDPFLEPITTDSSGKEIEPNGTKCNIEVNPTINGLYTVTVTAGEEVITQTLRVSSLYAQDFWNECYFTEEYAISQKYSNLQAMLNSWYKEGTTVREAIAIDADHWSRYTDTSILEHSESVNKYGGFYIARYEAGCETTRGESNYTLTTVYSKKNMKPYNYILRNDANTVASKMYNSEGTPSKPSVTSKLVNSAAWDRTLNWLEETDVISLDDMFVNSKNWGNYYGSKFDFTGFYSTDYADTFLETEVSMEKSATDRYPLGTGVTDYTSRNNIYDLAGNYFEWTSELYNTNNVIMRSGGWGNEGNATACSRVSKSANSLGSTMAFRVVLFITP